MRLVEKAAELLPHFLAIDAVAVKPVGRAVKADDHVGDVGREVIFQVSAACRIGLNKKQ